MRAYEERWGNIEYMSSNLWGRKDLAKSRQGPDGRSLKTKWKCKTGLDMSNENKKTLNKWKASLGRSGNATMKSYYNS